MSRHDSDYVRRRLAAMLNSARLAMIGIVAQEEGQWERYTDESPASRGRRQQRSPAQPSSPGRRRQTQRRPPAQPPPRGRERAGPPAAAPGGEEATPAQRSRPYPPPRVPRTRGDVGGPLRINPTPRSIFRGPDVPEELLENIPNRVETEVYPSAAKQRGKPSIYTGKTAPPRGKGRWPALASAVQNFKNLIKLDVRFKEHYEILQILTSMFKKLVKIKKIAAEAARLHQQHIELVSEIKALVDSINDNEVRKLLTYARGPGRVITDAMGVVSVMAETIFRIELPSRNKLQQLSRAYWGDDVTAGRSYVLHLIKILRPPHIEGGAPPPMTPEDFRTSQDLASLVIHIVDLIRDQSKKHNPDEPFDESKATLWLYERIADVLKQEGFDIQDAIDALNRVRAATADAERYVDAIVEAIGAFYPHRQNPQRKTKKTAQEIDDVMDLTEMEPANDEDFAPYDSDEGDNPELIEALRDFIRNESILADAWRDLANAIIDIWTRPGPGAKNVDIQKLPKAARWMP